MRTGPFCQQCGQNGHTPRHIATVLLDFINDSFYFEGKLFRTVPLLALHPGQFTRRYVAGERVKFVAPLALFLFAVFLLFAAISQLSAPNLAGAAMGMAKAKSTIAESAEKAQDRLDDLVEKRGDLVEDHPKADTAAIDKQIADAREQVTALKAAASHIPAGVPGTVPLGQVKVADKNIVFAAPDPDSSRKIATGLPQLDALIDHVRHNPELYQYKLQDAASKFSWALIPLSLPFIWLLFFWRRDVGMYDHAIFAFHSLTFMMLMTVVLIGLYLIGVAQAWLWLAFFFVPPLHMYKHLKYAYALGRFGAFWRTWTLLMMTSVTSALFFVLLLWIEAT
jgi:hypothetical protein